MSKILINNYAVCKFPSAPKSQLIASMIMRLPVKGINPDGGALVSEIIAETKTTETKIRFVVSEMRQDFCTNRKWTVKHIGNDTRYAYNDYE